MVNTLPASVADLIPQIRPDEQRDVAGALITLFGIMVGHALLETARDALFLANLPATRLPWAYLTIAAAALFLGRLPQNFVQRISPGNELQGWLWLASAITFGFWVMTGWQARWVLFALYAWSGVLATIIVMRFWIALGGLFTLTQAKRLFPLVGAGSVLGAIGGSALARGLTEGLAARHVVLAAALTFLATSAAPRLLASQRSEVPPARPEPSTQKLIETARTIWERPYLRRVGAIILLATITFTMVDFVFKSVVDRHVPAADLGEFFSSVYLGVNVLALIVQFFVVSKLVRWTGVHATQMVVPILLFAGGIGFSVIGGLALAITLKGIDGSLRHSVYRTTTELFFIPLSLDLRAKVKPLMDVVGQRGGQTLASLIIIVGASVTNNELLFALVAVGTAAAWLYLTRDIRSHYIDVFRQTLSEDITETRIDFPALDMASLETLLSTLNVPDDRKVIAALDLLVAQGKTTVIPALILYHPSPDVVVHALDIFLASARTDTLPIARRLVGHPAPKVRAASVRLLSVIDSGSEELDRALADDAPEVSVTALAGLIARGRIPQEDAQLKMDAALANGDTHVHIAFARAVHDRPAPAFERAIVTLARYDDDATQLATVRAMGKIKSATFVPILLELLSQRHLRREVRGTLKRFGRGMIEQLGAKLRDNTVPHRVRRQIPRAIGEFATPQASSVLVNALLDETDGMIRFKILRALGRLHDEHPGIPIDTGAIDKAIQQTVSRAFMLMRWRRSLIAGGDEEPERQTPAAAMLVALVRDKQGHSLERIFRLLNLRWNTEDFLRVHRGLLSGERISMANSLELVEQLVQPPLRGQLVELIADLYDDEQTERSNAGRSPSAVPYLALMCDMLDSRMESLSCIAAYHVAELHLTLAAAHLVERDDFSGYHRDIIAYAKRLLDESTTHA